MNDCNEKFKLSKKRGKNGMHFNFYTIVFLS